MNIEHVTINDNFSNDTDTINNTNTIAETMYNYEKNDDDITIRQTAAAATAAAAAAAAALAAMATIDTITATTTKTTITTATSIIGDRNFPIRATANSSNQTNAYNAKRFFNGPTYTKAAAALLALFHTNYSDKLANNTTTTHNLTVNNNIKFNYKLNVENNSSCIRHISKEMHTVVGASAVVPLSHPSSANVAGAVASVDGAAIVASAASAVTAACADAVEHTAIGTISSASIVSNRDSCSGETLH